jgi:hypothetical protein
LGNGIGVVDFDLDGLCLRDLNVDFEASGQFYQRSFSEVGISTRFVVNELNIVKFEGLDILRNAFRG